MIVNFDSCFDIVIKLYFKYTINIINIKFFIMNMDIIVKFFINFVNINIINNILDLKTFLFLITKMNHYFN